MHPNVESFLSLSLSIFPNTSQYRVCTVHVHSWCDFQHKLLTKFIFMMLLPAANYC